MNVELIGCRENKAKGLQLLLENGNASSINKWEFSIEDYLIDILKENKILYKEFVAEDKP